MPVPSAISELSQTAGSNYPPGSESPSTIDDYLRAHASFIARLRDGAGGTAEATIASAGTIDIGAATSQFIKITGTTTITSLGTNYNGARFIRFTGALTLTHNATTLILPGGVNMTTQDGTTCIAIPNSSPATGWRLHVTDISKSVLAASTGSLLIGWIQAGVSAVARFVRDKLRDHINGKDYGIIGDGSDEHVVMQALITDFAGRKIVFNKPLTYYNLGTVGLTIPSYTTVDFEGDGSAEIRYAGSGIGIDMSGAQFSSVEGYYLITSNDAAVGAKIGEFSIRCSMKRFCIQGSLTATNTGTGLLLDAGAVNSSLGLLLEDYYILGHKYGIQAVGQHLSANTWTMVTSINGLIVGRSAGIIAGSAGIKLDQYTNFVGSTFVGGSIESFDYAIDHDNGGFGLYYTGDIESNNNNYRVGASFCGEINIHPSGVFYRAAANGGTNNWMKERHAIGEWLTQTRSHRTHTLLSASGNKVQGGFKVGDSEIDGGTPDGLMLATSNGSFIDTGSFLTFIGQNHYLTANPAGMIGTFAVGDTATRKPAAIGSPRGWTCTTAGVDAAAVWTSWGNL